jgi:transcriptional regulator with XRE-family HTH domain
MPGPSRQHSGETNVTQGQIIGRLRKAAHVTQKELANAVGLKSKGNFSEWEKGNLTMPDRWFQACWDAIPRLLGQYRNEYDATIAELVAAGEVTGP